ncbi:MAG: response regulator transcription factor [Actinomycetota bacterium]
MNTTMTETQIETHAGSQALRVVLIEDHTLVRQSVACIISATEGFNVVAQAGTPDEGAIAVQQHRPDLVILDVGLPGRSGLDLAASLKAARPALRVMFLTMHEDDSTIAQAVALGADGYVLKSATTEELMQALHAIADGGSYLSPAVARRVMSRARTGTAITLTDRELEIIRMLSRGARPAEVASTLCLSLRTVRNHLANVYAKLNVSSAAQAIAEAFHRGIVGPTDERVHG